MRRREGQDWQQGGDGHHLRRAVTNLGGDGGSGDQNLLAPWCTSQGPAFGQRRRRHSYATATLAPPNIAQH